MNYNNYPEDLQNGFRTVATTALEHAGVPIQPDAEVIEQLDGYDHYDPRYSVIGDARAAIVASMVTGEVAVLELDTLAYGV